MNDSSRKSTKRTKSDYHDEKTKQKTMNPSESTMRKLISNTPAG